MLEPRGRKVPRHALTRGQYLEGGCITVTCTASCGCGCDADTVTAGDGPGQRDHERLEGGNMPYARGALGLGVYTKPKPRAKRKPGLKCKPKHDPTEIGRQLDVAISEFFEGGKK
jgi:hypothetical protein